MDLSSLYKYSLSSSYVTFPFLELITYNLPVIPSHKQFTPTFPLPKFKSSTMKSSKTKNNKDGKQQQDFLSPINQIAKSSLVRNLEYIPKPYLLEEKCKIYQSQVLIPLIIASKTRAYMVPLPDPNVDAKKLKMLFPTYHRT